MTRQSSRVLVVDDEPAVLALLAAMLTSLGYEVISADDGEKALQMVREGPPDVILLDIKMPAMDGYEVCRRLKADEGTREIPVIFVTGMTEDQEEIRGLDLGAVDYITKPFSQPVVKARIKTHLALRNAYQALQKQNQVLAENARLREDVERITRHDLKTPLSAVINVPGLLMKEDNLTPEQLEMLQMVEESGYRMLEIINSSLDLYKMEQGTYRPFPVPVNVLSLVNQIRGETRELVGTKGLSVRLLVHGKPVQDSDVFVVSGEEMLLYPMLANLIKNAVEASPEGNQITISLTNGDSAVISIHNMGAVPDDVRDRFFEKYATSGKAGGTGLGTYSAKLITETLGGRIGFDSSENNGTTVTAVFPRMVDQAPPDTTALKARIQPTALDKHLKVLVADDYSTMRRAIKGMLRQMGITDFLDAEDGEQALKLLKSHDVDLILADLNMPNLNGLDLLRHVRLSEEFREIPFIMITAEADKETVIEAGKAKVSGYIIKPFTSDLLKKKIEAALS